jgi:glycosyltransferase involved in cell wall biosynthesis
MEALQAFSGHDAWELVVRPGEGMEPADLLARPGVRVAAADVLDGIDLVVAPSWCESYPDEVARAAAAGLPVVATHRAAGFLDLDEVAPGDADGLRAAAERARPPSPSRTEDPGDALRALIRGESTRRMLATSQGG